MEKMNLEQQHPVSALEGLPVQVISNLFPLCRERTEAWRESHLFVLLTCLVLLFTLNKLNAPRRVRRRRDTGKEFSPWTWIPRGILNPFEMYGLGHMT